MEKNLLSYIWRHSRRQQIIVVLLTFLSFPILYMSLELPKWIINEAISHPEKARVLFGQPLDSVTFLASLCIGLLLLILLNGVLKMQVNTYKGIIGERMIRRLRYSLIDNLLRFPLGHFSHLSSGEIISTVTAETEPLAGYIGESIALPLFQGGTMLTILAFMFAQDWVFGLTSVALIPLQVYVIPKLQKQINQLKKQRVRQVRLLSASLAETVSGAEEIRLQGTERRTLAEYSQYLGDLFWIRLEIFKKKFFMKFLNNTIGQITPFLFYLFGGYLVIKGSLTLGALVAALAAHKDLTSPWKELLNFYQLHEDAKLKYSQINELFNPEGLLPIAAFQPVTAQDHLKGDIVAQNLSWVSPSGERVLSGVNFQIKAGTSVAITGNFAVRRTQLARLLSGLETPASGRLVIGDQPLSDIPQSLLRARLALQGHSPHIFAGTISDNAYYGLLQTPPQPMGDVLADVKQYKESRAAGNSTDWFMGDWRDFQRTGMSDSADWTYQVLETIGSSAIIYRRSLLEVFEASAYPELAEKLLEGRKLARHLIVERQLESMITGLDPDVFNPYSSLAENILFGISTDTSLDIDHLAAHPYLHAILTSLKLQERVEATGLLIVRELLKAHQAGLSSQLLEDFQVADEEELDRISRLANKARRSKRSQQDWQKHLTKLFLLLVPEKHHFAPLDARTRTLLLQARRDFAVNPPPDLARCLLPFDVDQHHPRLSVRENLLFGRINHNHPDAERTMNQLLDELVIMLDIRSALIQLFNESQVGINGSRLPIHAIHSIPLARILMKKPDILIFHDALAPLEPQERQAVRARIRKLLPDVTLIWINSQVSYPAEFDQVLEFSETGPLLQVYPEPPQAATLATPTTTDQARQSASQSDCQRSKDPYAVISHAHQFAGLSAAQHRYLANQARTLQFPANTTLYRAGDEADSVWLIITGAVVTERQASNDSGLQHLARLARLDSFGAMEVLADTPRILTACTQTDSNLLKIDRSVIENLIGDDVRVCRQLLHNMTGPWVKKL